MTLVLLSFDRRGSRHGEAQGHRASSQWNWNLNADLPADSKALRLSALQSGQRLRRPRVPQPQLQRKDHVQRGKEGSRSICCRRAGRGTRRQAWVDWCGPGGGLGAGQGDLTSGLGGLVWPRRGFGGGVGDVAPGVGRLVWPRRGFGDRAGGRGSSLSSSSALIFPQQKVKPRKSIFRNFIY